jgi:hypothetical protein
MSKGHSDSLRIRPNGLRACLEPSGRKSTTRETAFLCPSNFVVKGDGAAQFEITIDYMDHRMENALRLPHRFRSNKSDCRLT